MKKTSPKTADKHSMLRVGIVVPHIFMQESILPKVIFSPGQLAIDLAEGLTSLGIDVTLFSPGPVKTKVKNVTANLSNFKTELAARGDSYIDLLKKHPLTFISLARQVQSELIAMAYKMANDEKLDIVHIYTNEEDIALPFAQLCAKPVVFTHHDPFNFLVTYKNVFSKYSELNWISISLAQRQGMPSNTNWIGNVYHGLDENLFQPNYYSKTKYLAYMGRIIEPKGLHLAIKAVQKYNANHKQQFNLKIAGKHYAGYHKDVYWQKYISPLLDNRRIEYVGFISDIAAKQSFLANATALLIPSIFSEPFGMVAIEALACATPVICLDSGALPEIISNQKNGFVIKKHYQKSKLDTDKIINDYVSAIELIESIDRKRCRTTFMKRFTAERMCLEYKLIYEKLAHPITKLQVEP
jgi:glycosyltransferase involved in cell wall biosynthesis